MSDYPPRHATPLIRRIPPNASPEQRERAYADALLFVCQEFPATLERLEKVVTDAQAAALVASGVAHEAKNAVTRLGAFHAETRTILDRLALTTGAVETLVANLTTIHASAVRAVDSKVDALEEEVLTGRNNIPSERVRAVVKSVSNETELEARRARENWLWDIAKKGGGTVFGALLLWLASVLFSRRH